MMLKSKGKVMTKYVRVEMIFEPKKGSTLDIDELYSAVKESVKLFAPEPNPDFTHVEVRDTDTDEEEEKQCA